MDALAELTALDMLRLQSIDSPPRGLVMVVGCVGVLLGLCDFLPEWEGCKTMLKGQALSAKHRSQRRSRLAAAGAAVQQSVGFWQLLGKFDAYAVPASSRELVLQTMRGDIGGLMQPHHLEQVTRGAAALAKWLHGAAAHTGAPPLQQEGSPGERRSGLFDGPAMGSCPVCGTRIVASGLEEHAALCAAQKRERDALNAKAALAAGDVSMSQREALRIAQMAQDRIARLRLSELPPDLPSPRALASGPRLATPSAPAPPAPLQAPPPPPPPLQSLSPQPSALLEAAPEPPEPPQPPPLPPEPGFDYLRARSGYSAVQMTLLASPRPFSGRRRHAAQHCPPPAPAAAVPPGWGRARSRPLSGRRASAQTPTTSAEGIADGTPRRAEPRSEAAGGPPQPVRKGRRAAAAPSLEDKDSDDGEVPMIWTREMHVAAVQQQIQERGGLLPDATGFRKALA